MEPWYTELRALTKSISMSILLAFYIGLGLLFFGARATAHETNNDPLQRQPLQTQLEYAIFYMETEGEFVVPVGADAPAIYSWSEPKGTIKGDIPEIWRFLGIKSEIEYSFNNIESVLLNHVAAQGWVLQDLAVTSVPLPHSGTQFRTAYRYIFKRLKNAPIKPD